MSISFPPILEPTTNELSNGSFSDLIGTASSDAVNGPALIAQGAKIPGGYHSVGNLASDYRTILNGMASRHNIGFINNIVKDLGIPAAMVCGDQAAYTAASLEVMGYDAKVINGRDQYGATHSWIEVRTGKSTVELDPWDGGKMGTNNRARFKVESTWDVQQKDAIHIITQFTRQNHY